MTTGSPTTSARERRHTADGSGKEQERLVTVVEAAHILGISVATVSRWIAAGKLPRRKMGSKLVRIPFSAVRAFLDPEEAETDE